MTRTQGIIIGAIAAVAAGLLAVTAVFAADTGSTDKSTVIGPVIKIYKGKKCVRPTEFMRRNHMLLILHQRDETVHEGIRTEKYLLTNCIDCHANPKTNSVLGKDGFCASCHEYAAVSIDCFSCHSPSPEKTGPALKASASSPTRLVHMMQTSAVMTGDAGKEAR
ncbi:MAG: hypothetical protein ACYDBW_01355 [Sulfuricaulis sp.]